MLIPQNMSSAGKLPNYEPSSKDITPYRWLAFYTCVAMADALKLRPGRSIAKRQSAELFGVPG